MTFDPTLSFGNLLTIVLAGVGGLYFLWSIEAKLGVLVERLRSYEDISRAIGSRLEKMGADIDNLRAAMTAIAVQAQRLDAIDQRMNELSRRTNAGESATPQRSRKRS